jgi:5-methylcytosine-specific restriction endonuclease McrA
MSNRRQFALLIFYQLRYLAQPNRITKANYRLAGLRYRSKNRIQLRLRSRVYAKEHRAQRTASSQRRNARMRGLYCGDQRAIRKIYERAAELRQWFDVVVDHIRPLAKGGAHSADNLQIIYRLENCSKGTRLDFCPSVIFK